MSSSSDDESDENYVPPKPKAKAPTKAKNVKASTSKKPTTSVKAKDKPKTLDTPAVVNTSIVSDGNPIPTIAGAINQWKPCVENLPNHPTMVCIVRAFVLP